mmetsp:Transcript_23824/g.27587  ORF Transcript_23824/g.27587 Transcript_23824/m.27587 type:complete len:500 (+) Transcript_23824:819-2318(+)
MTLKPTSTQIKTMKSMKVIALCPPSSIACVSLMPSGMPGPRPMKRFGNILEPGYFENVLKKCSENRVRCNEYLENVAQFHEILQACEPSLKPEIEKLWYQEYGYGVGECPHKLMTIISILRNDDDKYNDNIHSRKDNDSDIAANITGVSVKNIKHESEENIKHNKTTHNTTTTTQSTKTKTKIDCDITEVHSNNKNTNDASYKMNTVDASLNSVTTSSNNNNNDDESTDDEFVFYFNGKKYIGRDDDHSGGDNEILGVMFELTNFECSNNNNTEVNDDNGSNPRDNEDNVSTEENENNNGNNPSEHNETNTADSTDERLYNNSSNARNNNDTSNDRSGILSTDDRIRQRTGVANNERTEVTNNECTEVDNNSKNDDNISANDAVRDDYNNSDVNADKDNKTNSNNNQDGIRITEVMNNKTKTTRKNSTQENEDNVSNNIINIGNNIDTEIVFDHSSRLLRCTAYSDSEDRSQRDNDTEADVNADKDNEVNESNSALSAL